LVVKFLVTFFWGMVQDLPVFIGFFTAIRVRRRGQAGSLAYLIVGTALTAVMSVLTEQYKVGNLLRLLPPPTLTNVVRWFLMDMAFALPAFFYCSTDEWWSNWRTDIVLGVVLGALYAVVQIFSAPSLSLDVFQIPMHLMTMAVAGIVFLLGVRRLRDMRSWPLALLGMAACTAVCEAIVAVLDYQVF